MFSLELMGLLLYLVGLFTLLIGVLATVIPFDIGGLERVVLYGAGVLTCSLGYTMATPGSGGSRFWREEQNMIAKLMGVAVFCVGLFMLILGLADLLGLGGLHYGFGERVLIYGGGLILCVIGYFMARRLPFVPVPPLPDELEQTTSTTEIQEGPPPERY
jgi:hypothetical protein